MEVRNSMVIAWLVNSMKPAIGKAYLFLPTAKEWDAVLRRQELLSNLQNQNMIVANETGREGGDGLLHGNDGLMAGARSEY